MQIAERFSYLKDEELVSLLEKVNNIQGSVKREITEKQLEKIKKYWYEINYILAEKGLQITLNEEHNKYKITEI